ncbi:hypothetical protein L195_g052627 [Trifolium pratense]|uniref:Uncharacterized protein n=1 Tax=Trifolium pratense TaxID=57577 RepID=A0A2K3K659_TRIPR|nr:hypothetical protein L195_g052627 [Trifolium pratense]
MFSILRACRGTWCFHLVFVAFPVFVVKIRGLNPEDLAFPFWVAIFSGCGVLDSARFARAGGWDLKGRVALFPLATCKGYLNSTRVAINLRFESRGRRGPLDIRALSFLLRLNLGRLIAIDLVRWIESAVQMGMARIFLYGRVGLYIGGRFFRLKLYSFLLLLPTSLLPFPPVIHVSFAATLQAPSSFPLTNK